MNNEQIAYAQYLMGSNNRLVCGIDTAIKALRPTARYDLLAQGGHLEFTRWEDSSDSTPPTKNQIFKELDYQQKFVQHWQYFLDRANSYPDIVILINELWEAMDSCEIPGKGTKFYNSIKKTNEDFPIPIDEPPVRPIHE